MWFIVTGSYEDLPDFTISLESGGRITPFRGPNLIDGQWHTIAYTYNGAGLESLYVDNIFVNAQSMPPHKTGYNTQGDGKNWLGTLIDGAGSYSYKFVGDLKDIAFYNYTLSDLQATTDLITE